jgi:uncharacterized protein (DUF1800 family)
VTGQAAAGPHPGAESAAGPSPADAPVDFRVISGNPTASELAAVTAVLTAAIEDLEDVRRRAEEQHGQTAWQRTQRPIRTPLSRGAGIWRSFSG